MHHSIVATNPEGRLWQLVMCLVQWPLVIVTCVLGQSQPSGAPPTAACWPVWPGRACWWSVRRWVVTACRRAPSGPQGWVDKQELQQQLDVFKYYRTPRPRRRSHQWKVPMESPTTVGADRKVVVPRPQDASLVLAVLGSEGGPVLAAGRVSGPAWLHVALNSPKESGPGP